MTKRVVRVAPRRVVSLDGGCVAVWPQTANTKRKHDDLMPSFSRDARPGDGLPVL